MIVTPRHNADLLLKMIVFVRPIFPLAAVYVFLCGVHYLTSARYDYGIILITGSLLSLACYVVTKNDWE